MNDVGVILARNLERFRRAKNLTLKELATIAKVPLDELKELEASTSKARSMEAVTRLASALGRTVFDLYREPLTMQSVRFRANKSFGKEARINLVDECVRRLNDYCFLEDLLGKKSEFNLQVPSRDVESVDPVLFASEARRRLNLSPCQPIDNVGRVLDKFGAKFWFCKRASSDKVFGLAFNETPQRTGLVVFENDSVTTERLIFSAFHELGHLMLHSRTFDASKELENKTEEREADQFAGEFLMPNEGFKQSWNDAAGLSFVERVLEVKRVFRVSYKTVLRRLVELDIERKSVYGKFICLYSRKYGEKLSNVQEPCGLERFGVFDDRFRSLVYDALKFEKITRSRAAEALGVSIQELRDELRGASV